MSKMAIILLFIASKKVKARREESFERKYALFSEFGSSRPWRALEDKWSSWSPGKEQRMLHRVGVTLV